MKLRVQSLLNENPDKFEPNSLLYSRQKQNRVKTGSLGNPVLPPGPVFSVKVRQRELHI